MNDERSLAKYSAASATSFTDPIRAIGRYAFTASRYDAPLLQGPVQIRLGEGGVGTHDNVLALLLLSLDLRQEHPSQSSALWTFPGRSFCARQSPPRLTAAADDNRWIQSDRCRRSAPADRRRGSRCCPDRALLAVKTPGSPRVQSAPG